MMQQFQEDLIAELAAMNMAIMKALSAIAAMAKDAGVPKHEYLSRVLEHGLRDLEKTDYWSIPAERRATVLENAKARYSDLITGISTD